MLILAALAYHTESCSRRWLANWAVSRIDIFLALGDVCPFLPCSQSILSVCCLSCFINELKGFWGLSWWCCCSRSWGKETKLKVETCRARVIWANCMRLENWWVSFHPVSDLCPASLVVHEIPRGLVSIIIKRVTSIVGPERDSGAVFLIELNVIYSKSL
jgi:hypothetical protein